MPRRTSLILSVFRQFWSWCLFYSSGSSRFSNYRTPEILQRPAPFEEIFDSDRYQTYAKKLVPCDVETSTEVLKFSTRNNAEKLVLQTLLYCHNSTQYQWADVTILLVCLASRAHLCEQTNLWGWNSWLELSLDRWPVANPIHTQCFRFEIKYCQASNSQGIKFSCRGRCDSVRLSDLPQTCLASWRSCCRLIFSPVTDIDEYQPWILTSIL